MNDPEFLLRKIDWLETQLKMFSAKRADWPKPEFVPSRVRLKRDVNNFAVGTDWGKVAATGDEVTVETTVHGDVVLPVARSDRGIFLNFDDFEVMEFGPNYKKRKADP